mmetsp:Transcript_12058/g.30938  ORF Transcript_12058/g.30938 Transcript_12058/m.30938 type:complete len:216 (+) Transcript_12058:45-692(+)
MSNGWPSGGTALYGGACHVAPFWGRCWCALPPGDSGSPRGTSARDSTRPCWARLRSLVQVPSTSSSAATTRTCGPRPSRSSRRTTQPRSLAASSSTWSPRYSSRPSSRSSSRSTCLASACRSTTTSQWRRRSRRTSPSARAARLGRSWRARSTSCRSISMRSWRRSSRRSCLARRSSMSYTLTLTRSYWATWRSSMTWTSAGTPWRPCPTASSAW